MTRRQHELPLCIEGGKPPCPICPAVRDCQWGRIYTTKRPATVTDAMRPAKQVLTPAKISKAGKAILRRAKVQT